MTDIVERLRWDTRYTRGHAPVTLENAADEIERLRAAIRAIIESYDELHVPYIQVIEDARDLIERKQ